MSYINLQPVIVYGPVGSKRLKKSLGINLLPADKKVCTFNCIYCHYGPTYVGKYQLPTPQAIESALKERISNNEEFDYITFAGNGEPTLHPQFLEISEIVKDLRDTLAPNVPIALISNSTFLWKNEVIEALNNIDLPILKLDAGDEETFNLVNRPVNMLEVKQIIENLSAIKNCIIQTVFLEGRVKNYCGNSFEKWLDAMVKISPKLIQIYSPDNPMPEENIIPLEIEKLREIAETISISIDAEVTAY
ncbi:MAG: radical SAM protein [Planctomycetota bacterium]